MWWEGRPSRTNMPTGCVAIQWLNPKNWDGSSGPSVRSKSSNENRLSERKSFWRQAIKEGPGEESTGVARIPEIPWAQAHPVVTVGHLPTRLTWEEEWYLDRCSQWGDWSVVKNLSPGVQQLGKAYVGPSQIFSGTQEGRLASSLLWKNWMMHTKTGHVVNFMFYVFYHNIWKR